MTRLLLILCLLGTAVRAEEPVCTVPADHPLLGPPRWYGLYYEDRKVGHAMTAVAVEGTGGERLITQRFEMTFRLEQAEENLTQIRRFAPMAPHRLVSGLYATADRRISYRQRGDRLDLDENGVRRIWQGLARTLCDEEEFAVHDFLQADPAIGDEIETADFDVEHLMLLDSAHRVEAASARTILGASHRFHALLTRSDNEVFAYRATSRFDNGQAISTFLGPIELRLETEAIARQPNIGVDLFAAFEKPLNRPLVDLDAVESLTLKVSLDDPLLTIDEVVRDAFMQRVSYLDQRTAIVRIGDYPAPAEANAAARYLRATSSHPADHPRLLALSERIRSELQDPDNDLAVAEAILHFVAGYIENVPASPYAYNTTSVFDVLDDRTGDCTEHSQLFVTLARAAGIPAREATGYVYGGNHQTPTLAGHAWVEVRIGGRWIGLDPTWQEIRLNRSHVQTRNDFVAGLHFEVLDVAYR